MGRASVVYINAHAHVCTFQSTMADRERIRSFTDSCLIRPRASKSVYEFVLFNKNNPYTLAMKHKKDLFLDLFDSILQTHLQDNESQSQFTYTTFRCAPGIQKGASKFVFNTTDFKYEAQPQYAWSIYFHCVDDELHHDDLIQAISIIRACIHSFFHAQPDVFCLTQLF
jgi:hypothetical protein